MTAPADLNHTTDAIDAVSKVTTDVADVMDGYAAMLDRAEDDLKPFIERLHILHSTHLVALKPHLDTIGGNSSQTGSAMGYVHQAVATVRDWVGKLDASALPQIADGEEMIVDSYTEAVQATKPNTPINLLLDEQRSALRAQIAVLKA
ncbi:DUF2383 domain-containing protein [Jannaschia sp. CCS1]|uniref:DUF2383 domain-containing protein n=1 Tax=Jannaschia sp. (strain CCS1) TaxID=290400 RepID=UPI000053BCC1|nr:DUF2383 domain-containing protein [Jannaschia sp. CCS1]ABD56479.1 hypothetical protein Jann_3562 [Jannaschia sp. CCS1]